MNIEELQGQLNQRIQSVLEQTGLEFNIRHLMPGTEAMATPRQSAIVQATEKLTGHCAEAAAYSTEGPFLNRLGMETVVLGPGHIAQAHQPDEYIEQDKLNPTVKILQNLIEQFCRFKQTT